MHAINLLKQQHQDVRDLFERIGRAQDASEKDTLLVELADNLAAHMTIEETMFYPAAYTTDETEFSESIEEHTAAKRILCQLLEMSADDDNFDDKVTRLQEEIDAHVEDEESELFTKAKQELEVEELQRLGEEMKNLFDEEMAAHPSRKLAQEVAEIDEEATMEVELEDNAELAAGE